MVAEHFAKELWAAYAAEDQSGDAGLPPLNIQYSGLC